MAYIGKRPVDTFPANNAVTGALISENAVSSSEIATNAVTTLQISDNAVTGVKIAENNITSRELAANTIATGNIADNAVDGTKIAQNSILTRHIDDAQVTADQLAASAVTTSKINDDAVTLEKLAGIARGRIIYGDASGNPAVLPLGSSGQALTSDGTDVVWGSGGKSTEEIQDIAGAMFSSNTETNITATYQDGDGTIDLVVGTLNQDTTGLAATATALATARTIHGVSFDGTANIDLSEVVQDTAGAMFSSNTETNITATYQDGDGTVDLVAEQQLNNTSAPYYHKVVVTVVSDGGNKYALDGGTQAIAKVTPNVVYRFDQSDSSNSGHPFRFGTAANGSEISAGYTIYNKVGSPGSAGAYTEVAFEQDAPGLLYYFCSSHSGMGAQVAVATEATLTQTLTNKTLTSPNITGLSLGGTAITATAAELNLMDGGTSGTSTTLVNADRVIINDAGTMKQVELSDLATYMGDNVTINQTQSALTVSGNTTIGGNLTVNGTTTTLSTTNSVIADRLIELGNGTSGTPANDMGIVMERGSSANAFMGFDESADKFIVGTGTFTGASTGNLSITTGTLVANLEGNVTGNVTGNVSGSAGSATGNAATATALQNARTIGGVSFDGTANIDLPGVTATGSQATTGNAATATKLAATKTIGGVAFDGSANINLPGVNAAGNQNTTGSAATLTTARAIAVAGDVTGTANFDGSAAISITTALAANTVDSAELVDGSIDTSHIADDQITQAKVANDAIGADELAANSVVSASIVNGSIVSADIAANTIALSNIADNAVNGTKIASNSILTRHIDDNQITGDQIADDIVLSGTGALTMPDGTTGQRPGSAAAGMFRYNTTLGKFEGYTDAWGEVGGGGSNGFLTDIFDGTTTPATDGSRTAFTLSQAVTDEKFLMVFIDGVYQAHAAYSVSGTTLTMADAPVASRTLTVHSISATVSGDGLTINNFSGDGSDTTFTLGVDPAHENNTQVYIDGVYQFKNTYAVDGTTLTFSAAPPNGTSIEVMTHSQTTINNAAGLAPGAISNLTNTTIASADHLIFFDATDNALKKGLASDLVENLTSEQVQDVVGAMVSSNTETGVAVTYEDGDGTLDFVLAAAQPTVTSLGTLTALTVDDITINGSTISDGGDFTLDVGGDIVLDAAGGDVSLKNAGNEAGKIVIGDATDPTVTLDVAGEINLDADGGKVRFKDAGTEIGRIVLDNSQDLEIVSSVSDKDIKLKGLDGSSNVTALTLDMSDAGAAIFNSDVTISTAGKRYYVPRASDGAATGSLYSPTGNEIRLSGAGSSSGVLSFEPSSGSGVAVHIDNAGKVGIGTTSPSGMLHVQQDASETNLVVQSNIGGTGSAIGGRLRLQLGAQSNSGSGNADTQAGDTLGQIMFEGQGTDYSYQGGNIKTIVTTGDGDDGRSNQAAAMTFETIAAGSVSPAERMRIQSGGGISFNGDTAAANALDDYEEGTWDPGLISGGSTNPTGGGYTAVQGHYVKIGRQVWVNFYVGRSWTNSPNGQVHINGLPFSPTNSNDNISHVPIVTYNMDGAGATFVAAALGGNTLLVYQQGSGAWGAQTWQSHATSTIYLAGQIMYFV